MFFNKKSKAMSFAELVVVFAIIGTISAITIPSLKRYSQRTELGEQAKKVYLNLEDAADNAILTEGPMRNWNMSSNKVFFEKYLEPNIRHTRVTNNGSCGDEACSIITVDGALLSVAKCNGTSCQVYADVNGSKFPNLAGKDQFRFQFTKSGDDSYYRPESIQPLKDSVESELRKHNWKFSDKLWDCTTASSYNGSCQY